MVESVLERLLIVSFKKDSKELMDKIFGNRGPLSDFNGKILIAEAYQIKGVDCEEMHRIRNVRNCFAHARSLVNLDTPEIASEIDKFVTSQVISELVASYKERGETSGYENFGRKGSFLLTCHLSMMVMNQELIKSGHASMIGKGGPV